jgi:Raf kinase inhibitor-like YbhB/YbcL family protein
VQGEFVPLQLTSRAFKEGGLIPVHHTGDAEDVSPPLDWSGVPEGTKSFAIVCDDPDAPGGSFCHWVIFNIPPGTSNFPEAFPTFKSLPNGTAQGTNDFGSIGYRGPAPPSGIHRYFFKLYALSAVLDLEPGAKKAQLESRIQRRIVGEAQLMGKYERK